MPSHDGIIIPRPRNLPRQLLQRLPLRLRDQKRGEQPAQHEQRKDLHDVVQPRRGVAARRAREGAARAQGPEDALRDDGADFPARGREAVRGGAVARREALAGHDEGGGVGAEVEEELGEDVERQEGGVRDLVVGEADYDEEDREHGEAHELDGLAAEGVDGRD